MKITPVEEKKNLLQKAKVNLVLQHPFFGVLACHLPTVPVGAEVFHAAGVQVPTAMVDGKKIYYYPPYVESLTERQRLGLLAHEVMHPALNHLWRRNNRRPDLWMKATDYAINDIILRTKNEKGESAFELPPGGLHDPKYAGMAAEQIYAVLFQEEAEEEKGQGKGKPGKQGKDKSQERVCGGQLEKPLEGDDEKRDREQKRKEDQKKMEAARERAEKKEAAEKDLAKKKQPQPKKDKGEGEPEEDDDAAGEKPEDAEGVEGEDGFDADEEGEGEDGEGQGEGEDGDDGEEKESQGNGQGKDPGQGQGQGKSKGSGGGGSQGEEDDGEGEEVEGEGHVNQQAEGHGGCCSHEEAEMDDADGALHDHWKELLNQAAMTAKARGKLPGHLDRLVTEATTPKVPWQQVLEHYVNDVVRDDYDMLKQDRRFMHAGIYFPELQSNSTKVGIVVDTSGSIGEIEIKAFVGEIIGILRCRGVSAARIIACDAEVTLDVTIAPTDPLPENYPGGGGTDFRPPFKRFIEEVEGAPPALIVYLTDMCGIFPDRDPGIPTIWLAMVPPYMKPEAIPKPSFGMVVPYEALTEDAAVTVNSF